MFFPTGYVNLQSFRVQKSEPLLRGIVQPYLRKGIMPVRQSQVNRHQAEIVRKGVGDKVLCEIAREMQLFLRKADSAARYGGEEFVILLPETELPGAALIANRLRQMVADTVITQDQGPPVAVTISIGIASLELDESGEKLLIRADQAMYRAKNNGRNRMELAS